MAYSDFPMPPTLPDFPRHDQIAEYFDGYVDHFGFRDRILFETGRSAPSASRTARGSCAPPARRADYDMLLVANGHHCEHFPLLRRGLHLHAAGHGSGLIIITQIIRLVTPR